MNNASAIARDLNQRLRTMSAQVVPFGDEAAPAMDFGPALTVSDGVARGIAVTVFTHEDYNLDQAAKAVFKTLDRHSVELERGEDTETLLHLSFGGMTPVIDEEGYRIGERLNYTPVISTGPKEVH